MAYENPLYLEDLPYNAKVLRQMPSALFADPGVLDASHLVATPAASGLTVNFTVGYVIVLGTTTAGQGKYLCWLSASAAVTLPAAPGAGQNRVDMIVAQVQDNDEDASGQNRWQLAVVEGTPTSGTPVAPAVPASSLAICQVATSGTQTNLTAGAITDLRVAARGWNELPGEIKLYAGSTQPMSWAWCDGRAASRTAFPKLFAAIGTTWGPGDGSTTFNLPDFRGRAPIGAGAATTGTSTRLLASKVGEENHIMTQTEMPVHNHGATSVESVAHNHHQSASDIIRLDGSSLNITPTVVSGVVGVTQDSAATNLTGGENQHHTHTTSNAGSGAAHNNMQPSIACNYIIRLA